MFERSGELVSGKFREYLIPTLLMTMSVFISNVVNSMLVGNLLGETALSAVGLAGPVIYCINAVFYLFAAGGMTCTLIAKGSRDEDAAQSLFTLTFAGGILAMSVLTGVILVFMEPMTRCLAGGQADLQELTAAYLTPLAFVGPVNLLVVGMALFARADGLPKAAAMIAIITNVANLVFAYVLTEFAELGIAGAGLATVLGNVVGMFVLIPYFRSRERTFRFAWPGTHSGSQLLSILRYGSPRALNQLFSFFRTLILNSLIMGIAGATGVAALAVCLNALMLTSMFIAGTNDTLLPIVGILFGERDYAGIRFALRSALKVLTAACLAMLLLFELAPGQVAALFGIVSPEGLAVVVPALRLYALSLPLYGINFMMQNFYQTTGRVRFASTIATLNGFVCIVFFAFVLSKLHVNGVWLAFLLSEAVTLAIIILTARRMTARAAATGGNVTGLLLLPNTTQGPELDVTIPAAVEHAVRLSENVITFCREHGMDSSGANRIGLAIEEMAVNTARFGHRGNKVGRIDVLVRFTDDDVIVRMRDDGVPFDPASYVPASPEGGLDLLRKLAVSIAYSRQLGFNATIVTVSRRRL